MKFSCEPPNARIRPYFRKPSYGKTAFCKIVLLLQGKDFDAFSWKFHAKRPTLAFVPISGKPHTGKPLFVKCCCLFKGRILMHFMRIFGTPLFPCTEISHKMHENPYLKQASKFYKMLLSRMRISGNRGGPKFRIKRSKSLPWTSNKSLQKAAFPYEVFRK